MESHLVTAKYREANSYAPGNGHYGLWCFYYGRFMEWFHCRDLFHKSWWGLFSGFFFCHPAGKGVLIEQFIHAIEDHLKVKHSRFYPTQKKFVLFVKPSWFWRRSVMRQSLFTILMKASLEYQGGEPWTALWKQHYLRDSHMAMDRFLSGYTRYTSWRRGWARQFDRQENIWCGIECSAQTVCSCSKSHPCNQKVDALLVQWWKILPIRMVLWFWKKLTRR